MSSKIRLGSSTRRWFRLLIYSTGYGLLGKLVNFGALTLYAANIDPRSFGAFSTVQIIATGAAAVMSSSFALAANTAASRLRVEDGSLTRGLPSVVGGIGRAMARYLVVASLISALAVPGLFAILTATVPPVWIFAMGLLTASYVFVDTGIGAIAGAGAVRAAAGLEGARAAMGGLAAYVLGSTVGVEGGSFGLVLFELLGAIFVVVLMVSRGKVNRDVNVDLGVVRAGAIGNAAFQIANWAMLGVIRTRFGEHGVGVYAVANRFATLVLLVPGFMSKNALGELSMIFNSQPRARFVSQTERFMTGVFILALSASMAVVIAVYAFEARLLSEYEGAVVVTLILAVGYAFRATASAGGLALVAQGAKRDWLVSDVVSSVLMLAAIWGLARVGGAGLWLILFSVAVASLGNLGFRAWRVRCNSVGRASHD